MVLGSVAERLLRKAPCPVLAELSRLVAAEPAPPRHVFTMVLVGVPKEQILRCAKRLGADLVVLGVSGRGAIERAVLGSTAHAVVRRSVCPVLTVKARRIGGRKS